MAEVVVDLYEDTDRVVRHVFYGRTLREADGIFQAHVQADAFLRAGVNGTGYHGIYPTAVLVKRQ